VPDGAEYDEAGIFVQDIFDVMPGTLRLVGNIRWSHASYESKASDSPLVDGEPLWPDESQDFSAFTFRAGTVWTPLPNWRFSANVSQGFRAPHITDLGTVGLTGTGFEVSPGAIKGLGATIGSTADISAVSTGQSAEDLDPEESLSYEVGIGFHTAKIQTELVGFINDIDGNIQKQALILPQGAIGTELGGEPITDQTPDGAVFVALSPNPVLINANFDDARIWGLEYTLDLVLSPSVSTGLVLTYLHAEDDRTHLPPNIEGGTPAPDGWLHVRWAPGGGGWWIEPYAHGALRQDRLSTLDLGDRRTGAGRTTASIANFFNRGARERGLIGNGPDGTPGTTDDVLKETGETLAEIQARVLGSETSSSLYTYIPGYAVFGLRGGYRIAQGHELQLDVENIGDRNYRGISWGVDAPGRSAFLRYIGTF